MAALQPQHLGGASNVAVVLVELLENEIALVGIAGLVQGGELAARRAAVAVTLNQRRQMLAVEARRHGIHDHNPLDHIAQFAHVARPRIAH